MALFAVADLRKGLEGPLLWVKKNNKIKLKKRKEEKPARHARFDELTIVTCPSM